MKKLIVIGDYCNDTLVCQELRSAISGYLKDPMSLKSSFVDTYPSTIHTGYLTSQVARTEERYGVPHETVIFVNTDPRIQDKSAVAESKGAEGVILQLASGLTLIGPNAGYNFSLVKDKIEKAFNYEPLQKGSQFRSRDLYPRVIAHLMDYMDNELDLEQHPLDFIPKLRGHYVGHIDNFGNLKTTMKHGELKGHYSLGEMVPVEINKIKHEAKHVDNLFGGNVGELVIYPGSSGSQDDPFLEISAWSHFADTDAGDPAPTGRNFFKGVLPGMKIMLDL